MEELKRELEARERCETEAEKGDGNKKLKDYSTTEALHAGQHVATCAYCDGKHYSDQCRTVTDVRRRKEILMKKRRCFLCTKGNHVMNDCFSKRKCFRCKGKHHTSICEKGGANGDERKKDESNEEKGKEEANTSSIAALTSQNAILLQTAQLKIKGVSNKETQKCAVTCKVIFDSGSQRSYVTKRAAKMIDARIHHKEQMTIGGFGGVTTRKETA